MPPEDVVLREAGVGGDVGERDRFGVDPGRRRPLEGSVLLRRGVSVDQKSDGRG
uniref:hypothetical protein n=1 Tax=Natronococcus occultus TaxID=29288 RepID=UPI001C26AFA7|nr:hypothetical protein [Natronococcus occultus]